MSTNLILLLKNENSSTEAVSTKAGLNGLKNPKKSCGLPNKMKVHNKKRKNIIMV
jgi:hypothetical protein